MSSRSGGGVRSARIKGKSRGDKASHTQSDRPRVPGSVTIVHVPRGQAWLGWRESAPKENGPVIVRKVRRTDGSLRDSTPKSDGKLAGPRK